MFRNGTKSKWILIIYQKYSKNRHDCLIKMFCTVTYFKIFFASCIFIMKENLSMKIFVPLCSFHNLPIALFVLPIK